MGRFKNRLYRFMYGRYGTYGTDTLNKVLLWIYLGWIVVCAIIELFIDSPWFTLFYWIVTMALVWWMLFRNFSKNVAARRKENERFCGFFKLRRNMLRDRKTHVYRKCPKCRAVLRLPRAKGKHTVVCPRCRERFKVRG